MTCPSLVPPFACSCMYGAGDVSIRPVLLKHSPSPFLSCSRHMPNARCACLEPSNISPLPLVVRLAHVRVGAKPCPPVQRPCFVSRVAFPFLSDPPLASWLSTISPFARDADMEQSWSTVRTIDPWTSSLSAVQRPSASWLREHPGIEIITRDRATEYARGATDGAPHALQVLDRWHLIGNLQEALVRMLDRLRSRLQRLVTASTGHENETKTMPPISIYDRDLRRGTHDQVRQQQGRARRYARYAEVKRLHRQGFKILQIARKLDISRQTVRTYIASEQFPERGPKPRQSSILDPYVAYLQERWDQGVRTNKQLYAELVERGFQGSVRPLVQWTMLRRDA